MTRSLTLCLVSCLFIALALPALATPEGAVMPWDVGLTRLIDNLTNKVARLLILGAVVISGLTWAFTEHNTGGRKVSQVVFGGAVAVAATSFLTALGIGAAVL